MLLNDASSGEHLCRERQATRGVLPTANPWTASRSRLRPGGKRPPSPVTHARVGPERGEAGSREAREVPARVWQGIGVGHGVSAASRQARGRSSSQCAAWLRHFCPGVGPSLPRTAGRQGQRKLTGRPTSASGAGGVMLDAAPCP